MPSSTPPAAARFAAVLLITLLVSAGAFFLAPSAGASDGDCPAAPVSRPGADLRHSEFPVAGAQADLRCADLTGATLDGLDLTQADLSRAHLAGASLVGTTLSQAELVGADLSRAHLQRADIDQVTATRALLVDADLTGVSAIQAHLAGADLSHAHLTDGSFDQADLSGANLTGADLAGAGLIQADLSGTTLDGVTGGPQTLRWAALLSGLAGLVIIGLAARSLLRRSRAATAVAEPAPVAGMPIYGATGGFASAGAFGGAGMGLAGTSGPPGTATVIGVMGGAVATAVGLFLMVTGLVGTVMDQLSPLATVSGAPLIGRFAVSPMCIVMGSLLFTGGIIVRSFSNRLF